MNPFCRVQMIRFCAVMDGWMRCTVRHSPVCPRQHQDRGRAAMTGQHADTNGLFACGLRLPDANKAGPGRMPGRNALGTGTPQAQSRWTTVRIVNVRWEMASMSWLDGMEGDDPAYPGPAADPWAVRFHARHLTRDPGQALLGKPDRRCGGSSPVSYLLPWW